MPDLQDYTVGWVCAITTEFVAAQAFLDEKHGRPQQISQNDNNTYVLGRIGDHNVVIAVLPDGEYGTNSAATVARDMLHSFPNVRIGLMVGIGGAAPSPKHDVRLGDIVVSSRAGDQGGVFQYDFGKTIQNQSFQETGLLNQPPTVLRTAVNALKAEYIMEGHHLVDDIHTALKKIKRSKGFLPPLAATDRLYRSDFAHPSSAGSCSELCGDNRSNLELRAERDEGEDYPAIHYGLIASANQLMKDARIRDKLAAEKGVVCFEMEAAGLMNHFPCLVIRGICDYADSHKNEEWQGFAAMAAAAYAKDLLRVIAPNKVEAERRICEILSTIEKDVKHARTAVETIKSDQHVDRIARWLRPPNASTNANHARKLRHKGTGDWFLNSEPFAEWKLGSRQHLWLHGLPGCGKTVLSATILDHLSGKDDILMYYFDFTDSTKRTVDGMARSLVFQLYSLSRHSTLDGLFESHCGGKDEPATKTLLDTLHTMLESHEKVFLLLDAMDECNTKNELLAWIQSFLLYFDTGHVQLIATSRLEEEFLSSIPASIGESNCLSLDRTFINADIHSYIMARVQSPEFGTWAEVPEMQEQICNDVGDRADGMFRLAACQLDSLKTCLDRESIESTLKALPCDLDGMYRRILERIPESRRKKAYRLLQFLIHSERPLTLDEAVDIIAVRIDSNPRFFNTKDRMPRPHQITRFCPSLVSIVRGDEESEELQLAHLSVKEFLLKDPVFDIANASIPLTITCLAYLSELKSERHEVEKQLPFARLAASSWMDHARFAELSEDAMTAVLAYLQSPSKFHMWTKLHQPDRPGDREPEPTSASCLYFACLKGLYKTVKELLSQGASVDAEGGFYGSALKAVSYQGHRDIVELLLDKGANVNAEGGFYGSALQVASYRGHRDIVELLLDKGANVSTEGGRYGSALQAASDAGHRDIVEMLLETGANVNAEGGFYGNALQAASSRGHRDIVELLLETGADINTEGGFYGSALQAASDGGHRDIVELLLDKDANVNAEGNVCGSALQAASYRGHRDIVELLLEKGANVNTEGGIYGSALQAASDGGDRDIIELLLEKGANINAKAGIYGSALQVASYRSHRNIVELLLEKGADIDAGGGRYGSALQAASDGGDREVIELLLEKGACNPVSDKER